MNILYINCHDLGRYLQPYGYAIPSPNLQAFAERATLFRNAHTPAPTCSPSRASLLTGTLPHESMRGLTHLGFSLEHKERHLARYLSTQRYHTVLAGIQHEDTKSEHLYQEILKSNSPIPYNDKDQGAFFILKDKDSAENAAQFLHSEPKTPFLLACGFFLPHREFPLNPIYNPNTVRPPEPMADTPENRLDWARFMTAVKGMDDAVGIILDALKNSRRDKDTLVIFTTDHGPAFPEMKCRLTDFGTNNALIIDYPDNPSRGKAIDALVSHLDLFPTIAEIANIEKPNWLRGASLLPIFQAPDSEVEIHDAIFGQVNYHVGYEPMRSIRTRDYKLIRMLDEKTTPVPGNIDNSASKEFWLTKADMLDYAFPRIQLFDLKRDPMERHNCADEPAYAKIRATLEEQLDAYLRETNDPASDGYVPHPEGATIAPRDQYAP